MGYMRDASGRRLDALTVGPRDNTIVWLGDSIPGNGGGIGTVNPTSNYSRGFWVWALNFLGQRLRTLANAGIGGQRSDEILARLFTDVIALRPGWCHVQAGTNDIAQGISLATIQANLAAMWDALDRAGIRVITGTVPPRASYTGNQRAQGELLNAWIKDQGRRRRNLVVVDYHSVLVFTSSTTSVSGGYAPGLNFDTIHPSTVGAAAMGKLLADTIAPLIPPAAFLASSEGDATNLIANGRFGTTGGNGAVIGNNWGVSSSAGTLTYSKVPRTDGVYGSWQSINLSTVASASFLLSSNATVGAGLAVGDTISAALEYQLSGLDTAGTAGQHCFYLTLTTYDGASFGAGSTDLVYQAETFPTWDRKGVLRTPPIVVPAGATLAQLQIRAYGGGTYLLDRAGIFNHTQLALAG